MKIPILSIFTCCMLLTMNNANAQKKSKQINKEYIDRSNMDLSVKPGDNFYYMPMETGSKITLFLLLKPAGEVLMC